jgi:uncharacterized repeat protein (TIGR01451 family)
MTDATDDLAVNWQYPELRVEISNDGGPYQCGEGIEWTIDVFNDGPVAAEMVRVSDTVGAGMNFVNGGAAPNGNDFYLTATGPGSGPTFDWDTLASRAISWEIASLAGTAGTCAVGDACHRRYTLWTRIDSGNCDDPAERTNTVDATWHCSTTDTADEIPNPMPDESVCTAGATSDSLEANVSPDVNVSASVSPATVPQCAISTDIFY